MLQETLFSKHIACCEESLPNECTILLVQAK